MFPSVQAKDDAEKDHERAMLALQVIYSILKYDSKIKYYNSIFKKINIKIQYKNVILKFSTQHSYQTVTFSKSCRNLSRDTTSKRSSMTSGHSRWRHDCRISSHSPTHTTPPRFLGLQWCCPLVAPNLLEVLAYQDCLQVSGNQLVVSCSSLLGMLVLFVLVLYVLFILVLHVLFVLVLFVLVLY